jgi:hypothetical protein
MSEGRHGRTSADFEGEALARLKLAAEEIAFLNGRGYDPAEVKSFVARRRALTPAQEEALLRSVCSEPQYRARAMKEMLPEDIARRPLLVDAHDVVDAITTALAGGVLLEGLDQTFQPLVAGGAPEHVDAALDKIGPVLRDMRPSKTKWLLAESRVDAQGLSGKILASQKKWKVPVEVEISADPWAVLRKSTGVATNAAAIIETCKSWCNLAGPVVVSIASARRVKLQ